MNLNRIGKLSNLVKRQLRRRTTIILDPTPIKSFRIFGNPGDLNVAIDADEWIVPDELHPFIYDTAKEDCSVEEKIIKVYQKLCTDYTYDDNVLSYIKKNDDESFYLPDDYGRDTDEKWKEQREKHNRRNCFEISRILAKSMIELFEKMKNKKDYDVCIIWDEAVTHYLVGLASNDYFVTLDLDDFNQIKDLTRMKTGLTLDGIVILEENSNKFKNALDSVNANKEKDSQDAIMIEIPNIDNTVSEETIQSNDLKFIQYTVQILKEKYNLDSAGVFEYVKEIIDLKLGRTARHTYWKEIEESKGIGARYTRCLTVSIEDTEYVVDVTKDEPNQIFRKFSKDEGFIPFKEMNREWENDPYDGR